MAVRRMERVLCAAELRDRHGVVVRMCGGVAVKGGRHCGHHLWFAARSFANDLAEGLAEVPVGVAVADLPLESLLGVGIYVTEGGSRYDGA